VRLLLDECLSRRLGAVLGSPGRDVVHVLDVGLAGQPDEVVLAHARDEHRVLISADTDFGELLAREGAALPSLILLRSAARTPEHQARTILANLDQIADELNSGAIVVFTNDSIRIRSLPITR